MNTDVLIEMLARGAGPAPRAIVARRLAPAMVGGVLVSSALALLIVGPLPFEMLTVAVTWVKLAYALALAAAAALLTARLARPLGHLNGPRVAAIAVIATMALAGGLALMYTPEEQRVAALLGQSWLKCPWLLMTFSLPALAALLWALRGLAPTRPGRAGFACGLLAGALGAAAYALTCPESSMAFVAVWYTLGILLTAMLGWVLGPRVLRW